MAIHTREAVSKEMQKSIVTVRKMSGGMGFDENMAKVNWRAVRMISNFGYQFMPKEKGVKFSKIKVNGKKAELAETVEADGKNVIVYLHGGGFVSGSAASSRGYASMLAKYAGCRVIAVDYALAPEKPYPHGFEDCCGAVSEIIKLYPDANLAMAGESAGANLCLAVAMKMKQTGKIKCVIAHSPFVDFTGGAKTEALDRTAHEINDFTVHIGAFGPLRELYVGSYDPHDPTISPIYGDFENFPATFLTCDANEVLYADALAVYCKCIAAGVPAELVEMKGAFHAFATIGTGSPETMQILQENVAFMKQYMGD